MFDLNKYINKANNSNNRVEQLCCLAQRIIDYNLKIDHRQRIMIIEAIDHMISNSSISMCKIKKTNKKNRKKFLQLRIDFLRSQFK